MGFMERFICIHGHFYQPPRENPWLEAIELQDSAYPYHDWNVRITAECYAPNAAARILDGDDFITEIVNNYAKISFNFGPTLLAWLEAKEPDVYRAILAADKASQDNFSGHGSALAQVYNHMILPLANRRDKVSQVLWGIRDFEHRFGRSPEGMWLAETAVDLETLEVLAEQGIKFTILAPYQAGSVRPLDDNAEWEDVTGGGIDPTRPYLQRLSSGREMVLFFYDGPISRGIAFEGLLNSGEAFAGRLVGAFNDERDWPQLVHIATDGETYGHHHKRGEMALAYALRHIEENDLARLTNYGEYLAQFPPTHEVQIVENTAWSCFHGVGRWEDNCGCNSGGYPDWTQNWRKPLRAALDWLRDDLAARYEVEAGKLLRDPWAARDDYISVVLNRQPDNRAAFLARHGLRELDEAEQVLVWKLLELQRHAMLMYTSCGWFFDELSGLETVQVIHYAGRAVQLANDIWPATTVEADFLDRLAEAKSNIAEHGDGRQIYAKWVKPTMIDLPRVAMHYGVSSLFKDYIGRTRVYAYTVEQEDYRRVGVGRSKLAIGRVRVQSEITQDAVDLIFAVLHFGDHSFSGGVRRFQGEVEYEALVRDLSQTFEGMDLPAVLRSLDESLEQTYPLQATFRDEQRRIAGLLIEPAVLETHSIYQRLYERHAPLLRYLGSLSIPLPDGLGSVAHHALNRGLREALATDRPDFERIQSLLDEAQRVQAPLDEVTLGHALKHTLERIAVQFQARPTDEGVGQRLDALLDLVKAVPFHVSLWRTQNIYYEMLQNVYPVFLARAADDLAAEKWTAQFINLGQKVGVHVPSGRELGAPGFEESTIVGTVRVVKDVYSPQLDNTRDLYVYLPPSYDAEPARRYPVIYMHDGQNLFDQATSFAGEWQVDETMQALSWEGIEAIVVGIPNMGSKRCDECSPFCTDRHGGGQGDQYLAFIVETVKPLIDAQFRTLGGQAYTGVIGSSMGGLISLYAFFRYPEVFGVVGALSPSLWFASRAIFETAEQAPFGRGKIYLDAGTAEGRAMLRDVRAMRDLLVSKGYRLGHDLLYVEEQGSPHHETAWARRLPDALRFLIPVVPTPAARPVEKEGSLPVPAS